MKYFCIVILSVTLSISCTNTSDIETHFFILSGQSNMVYLNPYVSFIPTVEAAFGKYNVIVVKDAHSGQPIRRWYKNWKPAQGDKPMANGDLYDILMEKVKMVIEGNKVTTITFIWMQGEADAREKHGDVYSASLKGLIDQIKNDLGKREINFVIGRLSDFDMDDKRFPHWTMIREAQVTVAETDPNGAWVDTDDLNDVRNSDGQLIHDDLHYTLEGYNILGKRFANKAITLIKQDTQPL